MSNEKFNALLNIEQEASFYKWGLVIIPHLFALCIVLLIPYVALNVKFILVVLIIVSSIFYSRLHLIQGSESAIKSIRVNNKNMWSVNLRDDELVKVDVLPSSFISNWLIILNLKRHDNLKSVTALITIDSLDNDTFRHLKVKLKNYHFK